jgi:hypothetical protein
MPHIYLDRLDSSTLCHAKLLMLSSAKTVLLFMVALHNGAHWMLENPGSSIDVHLAVANTVVWKIHIGFVMTPDKDLLLLAAKIDVYPRLAELMNHRRGYTETTWLGMYGAATPKLLKLISSDVAQLHVFSSFSASHCIIVCLLIVMVCYLCVSNACSCMTTSRQGMGSFDEATPRQKQI